MFTSGETAECEIVGKRAIAYYNCQHMGIKKGGRQNGKGENTILY